jgi:hypothetical protein
LDNEDIEKLFLLWGLLFFFCNYYFIYI